MRAMGIDIGTTTISAVLMDGERQVWAQTIANGCEMRGAAFARLQDAEKIYYKVHELARCVKSDVIGLTGQMHGILYANADGHCLSPLYTWQDGRGDLLRADGKTYAQGLSEGLKRPLATGYGAVTHDYNVRNGIVPEGARWAMTIADYVGMRLCNLNAPMMHISNAASLGAPDWDGICDMIRSTDETRMLGAMPNGTKVAIAIGDNQASFLGATRDAPGALLLNMGTGGQISAIAKPDAVAQNGLELRPYIDGAQLIVGFSLCGGRAYALLEGLFSEIAGAPKGSMYEQMNSWAQAELKDPLSIRTTFCGTRQQPALRGAIAGISDENLTAAHLVRGTIRGMADELIGLYEDMKAQCADLPVQLFGAGNGLRKNAALRAQFEEAFGAEMAVPRCAEEAAMGAAVFAGMAIAGD